MRVRVTVTKPSSGAKVKAHWARSFPLLLVQGPRLQHESCRSCASGACSCARAMPCHMQGVHGAVSTAVISGNPNSGLVEVASILVVPACIITFMMVMILLGCLHLRYTGAMPVALGM